ncbi:MAG: hypothetical protein GY866_18540 [Proteobacteria bacterium]|nr:hypothetical protein [Pseudomonadota bacterium]
MDLAPGLHRTPGRWKYSLFTDSFVEFNDVIWTLKDRDDIQTGSDLDGKIVAVEKGEARGLALGYVETILTKFGRNQTDSVSEIRRSLENGAMELHLAARDLFSCDCPGTIMHC